MRQHISLLIICIVLHIVQCQTGGSPDVLEGIEECVTWQEITESLDDEENVDMECQRNSECSGLDCLGDYTYDGFFSEYVDTDTRFCFGMVVEPCTTPTMMQIYIGIFQDKNSNTTTETTAQVQDSTQIPVKGVDFQMLGQQATPVLDITMNHTSKNNKPHIFLAVVFRVMVDVDFFGFRQNQPLDDMEVTIVEPMYIPVPPCDPRAGNHTREKGQCSWSSTFNMNNTGKGKRKGNMTPCGESEEKYNVDDCENYEMCENKQCVCIPEYGFDPATGACVKPQSTEYDIPVAQQEKGSKKHVVVIVCSVLGVLVLSAVGVTLFVKVRRYRKRYAGRQLVLSEDNEDDLEVEA